MMPAGQRGIYAPSHAPMRRWETQTHDGPLHQSMSFSSGDAEVKKEDWMSDIPG